nr:dATP/dGTP pyrophosphohydrolase domain-containing protein [Klebsiella pneumoniae]
MTNNQLTDERVTSVIERLEHYACNLKWTNVRGAQDLLTAADGLRELQERRKAAMDSEPVAWTWHYREQWHVTNDKCRAEFVATDGDVAVLPLYRHAQPAKGLELAGWQFKSVNGDWLGLIDEHGKNQAVREGCEVREVFAMADGVNDRDQVRIAHAEWSQATFGNVGPVGPLKHLAKEAMEAAVEPDDLSEWADMQFLLWDAQRRAGITDEQITQAMIEKLAVNKQRKWPAPKDGEPRLHIKSQPAPVITFYRDGIEAAAKWIDQQREAYDSEHGWSDPDTGAFEFGNDAQRGYSSTLEELAEGIRALHPNAGNSPVITDRWIPVSEKLPERGDYLVSDGRDFDVQLFNGEQFIPGFVWEDKITHWMPLPATPQEVK